jgi:hypothetical protein
MQNFGKIKNAFNGLLVESFVGDKESNKNLFKTYIKTIRENEALKTQFLVYNNIENKIEENEFKANLFLQENIALLNKFSKKDLLEANQKLAKAISIEDETYEKQELHENLSELIFLKKSSKNIDAIVEATSKIIIHMKNNKLKLVKEAIELPNSMLSTIMVEKYNERYSTLDENEKEILKVLIESTDEQKQEVYKKTLKECIELINENLKEADLDAKDKLLQVKEKLLNDTIEVNENFFKNISKLVDLKSSLKNNE